MNRDDELTRAKMRHPAHRHKMIRDVEAFAREAARRGIDVTPLHTASRFHAESDRPWESKTRPRKGRRRDIIATVAAWLLLVLAMFIIISAVFASAAKADTADDWADVYAGAVCQTLDKFPSVEGLYGVLLGAVQTGLTDVQAGEAVAVAVIRECPEYRPLLVEFIRKMGRI